mmetsp:Transcript_23602/g.24058  ORF Transcript_23602/g.24058 Transcript_23602/m.24058 type:complete len:227 (-) Transcript_23602:225-905(-)
MSWKAGLSRQLPVLRFFCCTKSPSSRGVYTWYKDNYEYLKKLNPTLPLQIRTTENAMPAVTTELSFTNFDVVRFMLQTGKFVDGNGSISASRVEAATEYLKTDWPAIRRERWASPGFDPERPHIEDHDPYWKEDPKKASDLATYIQLKEAADAQLTEIKSGPNREYAGAKNSLIMMQRVDLWCAGPKEVEAAVYHLSRLAIRYNNYEPDTPDYITEYYPGAHDFDE